MAPIIHCIRHAQGFHNLGSEFHCLRDPRLTPKGEEQCSALQSAHFPPDDQSRISLITASPLTRTLHTAFLTFRPALTPTDSNGKERQMQILALPDAQETSDYPCDTGSDVSALQSFVAEQGWPVDLSLLTPDWNVKGTHTRYFPHSDAIKARALTARQLIRQKARDLVREENVDAEIVLVSHGGYLHYFTDDWEDATGQMGTGWRNCEVRSYEFEDLQNEGGGKGEGDDARLVETITSRTKRGLRTPMPGREEQGRLFVKAMEGWEAQGLQRPDQLGVEEPETGRMGMTAETEMEKVDGPEREREREVEVEVPRQVEVTA